jgi:hypothetical protein
LPNEVSEVGPEIAQSIDFSIFNDSTTYTENQNTPITHDFFKPQVLPSTKRKFVDGFLQNSIYFCRDSKPFFKTQFVTKNNEILNIFDERAGFGLMNPKKSDFDIDSVFRKCCPIIRDPTF